MKLPGVFRRLRQKPVMVTEAEKRIIIRMKLLGIHDVEVIAPTRQEAEDAITSEGGNITEVFLGKRGFVAEGDIPGGDAETSERLEGNGWTWGDGRWYST